MEARPRMRRATRADAERLRAMHRASFEGLAGGFYSAAQIEGLLAEHDTVDEAMLADGTLMIFEQDGRIAASGGWTMRAPAYLGRRAAEKEGRATIRSVFTHPDFVRRGLASTIVGLCEEEAVMHGLALRIELCATLSGVALYRRLGYEPGEPAELALANGEVFPVLGMAKQVGRAAAPAAAA